MNEKSLTLARPPRLDSIENGLPSATSPAGAIAVEARNISKSYARGPMILSGISMDIKEGETVALIGANGSGKSTLLKCLAGVHPVDSGEVDVFGATITAKAKQAELSRIRRNIGFVFQNHGLVRRLSVLSNVIHGKLGDGGSWRAFHQAVAPREMREEALAALEMVGLADKIGAQAEALSGGQSQRVAIARALIRKPRLLIADEPAASLDPVAGNDVMTAFVDIAARARTTLLFTTHDLEHALNFASRIIALKSGAVVLDAPSASLSRASFSGIYG